MSSVPSLPPGFLFDTDAILVLLVPRPDDAYLRWLSRVPREAQFTSALVLAELYEAACRQGLAMGTATEPNPDPVTRLRERLLPTLTVLPLDSDVALTLAQIRAGIAPNSPEPSAPSSEPAAASHPPQAAPPAMGATRDLQIAATALHHGLHLVTGRAERYATVPALVIEPLPAPTSSVS